jgi:hypothetical protein
MAALAAAVAAVDDSGRCRSEPGVLMPKAVGLMPIVHENKITNADVVMHVYNCLFETRYYYVCRNHTRHAWYQLCKGCIITAGFV